MGVFVTGKNGVAVGETGNGRPVGPTGVGTHAPTRTVSMKNRTMIFDNSAPPRFGFS
jgi:hypothetical protein